MEVSFNTLNTILPLKGMVFKNGKWECACYIDGTPHHQKDKTIIKMFGDVIMIHEQGGVSMSINKYMKEYMNGTAVNIKTSFNEPTPSIEPKFVSCYPVGIIGTNNNLYKFLCAKFGYKNVNKVFQEYYVEQDQFDQVVFWYINYKGQTCHDNRIAYMPDGKRNKEKLACRWYKTAAGYTNRALFGEHLLSYKKLQPIIVESEKTAIIMSIICPNFTWLASGAASHLSLELINRVVSLGFEPLLYPDLDYEGLKWKRKFSRICDWFLQYEPFIIEGFGTCQQDHIKEADMKQKYPWFSKDIADFYL